MSPGSLTLLTARYPFATGEDFVTTELGYLCQTFREVHILPTSALPPDACVTRALPANAFVRQDMMQAIAQARRVPEWRRVLHIVQDADGRRLLREEAGDGVLWRGPSALWPARAPLLTKAIGHALMLRDVFRKFPSPDLVYDFWLNASALGACLSQVERPVVSRAHGADLYVERDPPYYIPLQRATLRRLKHLFGISEQGVRYLQTLHPSCAEKIELHRLGVAPAPAPTRPSEDGVQRVLSVSSLLDVKQVHILLEALRGCSHRVLWTHLGDGPERAALQTASRKLPGNVRVVWAGSVAHEEVLRHYQTSPVDVFVNVSRSEGLPVSIMEALSYGVPVIAPDVGGIRELVQKPQGTLVPDPARAEDVREAIADMVRLPPGEVAHIRAAAQATWAKHVDAQAVFPPFASALAALSSP